MSDTTQLIQQCNECFSNENYAACTEILQKLRSTRSVKNAVVDFNSAVANFAQSLWYSVEEFSQTLSNLGTSELRSANLEEFYFFNQAVLAFHVGQFSRATDLLNKIFHGDGVPEIVLNSAVLLMAEIFSLLRQPEQSLKILTKCDHCVNEKEKTSSTSNELLKYRICLAKVKAYLMLRNYKACQKEAKKLTSFVSCSVWTATMFRAQLEYQRATPQKSVKSVLNARERNVGHESYSATGVCHAAVELNALGCLYYQMNKPNLSLVYFRKAINEYSNSVKSLARNADGQLAVPLYCRSSIFRLWLLQNYGLALLHCQQPAAGFDCLIEIVKVVNNNSRLWLRLAECCILFHRPNNEIDFEMQKRKRCVVKDVIGVGVHRKVILNTDLNNRKTGLPTEQGAIPTLSLEFAHFCLKNAMATLPVVEADVLNLLTESNNGETTTTTTSDVGGQTYPAPFSNPMSIKEVYRLKCSILCATSYVCLCLGEVQLALESAKTLMNQKFLSTTHKLLAHLYAAEASILADRMTDALSYLKVQLTSDRELTFTELWNGKEPVANWFPKTSSSFKTIFLYNLALAYTLQEDFDKAIAAVSSIGENVELPIQVTMLGLYIQIHRGQIDAVRYSVTKIFPKLQTVQLTPFT